MHPKRGDVDTSNSKDSDDHTQIQLLSLVL